MITDRQKTILMTVVNEYIKTAQPVGSQAVYANYDFNVSTATLRNELALLESRGYLSHPHTSSGRVPTDKGYRFFVDAITEEKEEGVKKARKISERINHLREEEDALFAELARTVASLSRNMVLSGPLGARMLFRAGINEILSQPELEDFSLRKHFGHIIDSFEDNLEELSGFVGEDAPRVFIGRENPISAARDFSMIVSRCRLLSDEGVVVIVGPKRMNYQKNLELLNSLIDML